MYYYHRFADDEIETQKGKSTCPNVTREISGRTYPYYTCPSSINPQTNL